MRFPVLLAVPVIALTLAGCSAQEPVQKPAATSTEEKPLFASDEEALSAAEAVYANYLQVSDQIARDGGANPERLKGLVSEDLFINSSDFAQQIREKRLLTNGQSEFTNFHLQKRLLSSESEEITTYLCLNVGDVRILDLAGADVTPADRQEVLPMLISFSATKSSPNLIIESSEVWAGTNFC